MSKNKKHGKQAARMRRLKIIFGIQIVLLLVILGALAFYFFGGYAKKVSELRNHAVELVNSSNEDTFRASQTSVVYDVNGKEISVVKGEKDSYYLEYKDIPEGVKAAIVSIEDKKFYKHHGVDVKAVVRAAVAMLRNQKITQGGSTITQQLARTVFLSNERTWQRKIEELYIAVGLEQRYSKEQILEFYLNNVNFSNGYYGIEAAARGYFNCSVTDLSLADQALLCGIPNNPTLYDPVTNLENATKRRNRILKQMLNDGKIQDSTYEAQVISETVLNRPKRKKSDYVETFVYHCATKALMKNHGFEFRYEFDTPEEKDAYNEEYDEMYASCQKSLFTAGYRIYTSIDMKKQKLLQQSIDEGLAQFDEKTEDGVYTLQASGTCIDNETGYVTAIVGGRSQDFNGYTLNRAYQSFRQPGSSIKPLVVYTPALEHGFTPDSIVLDARVENGPSNSSGNYSGNMTLRSAVEQSKNTVAWRVLQELSPSTGLEYLKKMNFSKLVAEDNQLAIALGGFTYGMSSVEMASGYTTIENDGIYREPTCVMEIQNAKGETIYADERAETEVYDQNAARAMTDIMQGVFTRGTARGLGLGDMPCAGKTGTTNDHKDGWFCGFTRYYTTAIWVGYDNPKELSGLYGASYPGHIWQDYMLKIHESLSPMDFMPYISYNDSVHVPEQLPEEEEEQTEEEEPEEETLEPQTPKPPVDLPEEIEGITDDSEVTIDGDIDQDENGADADPEVGPDGDDTATDDSTTDNSTESVDPDNPDGGDVIIEE